MGMPGCLSGAIQQMPLDDWTLSNRRASNNNSLVARLPTFLQRRPVPEADAEAETDVEKAEAAAGAAADVDSAISFGSDFDSDSDASQVGFGPQESPNAGAAVKFERVEGPLDRRLLLPCCCVLPCCTRVECTGCRGWRVRLQGSAKLTQQSHRIKQSKAVCFHLSVAFAANAWKLTHNSYLQDDVQSGLPTWRQRLLPRLSAPPGGVSTADTTPHANVHGYQPTALEWDIW